MGGLTQKFRVTQPARVRGPVFFIFGEPVLPVFPAFLKIQNKLPQTQHDLPRQNVFQIAGNGTGQLLIQLEHMLEKLLKHDMPMGEFPATRMRPGSDE